ncbi:carboxypeptidase-like regulatory domain-containing protein [Lacinutrix mariniflava]|uniref:carboxypeptidase-like regulatory domain-containing protein n=1 Tax=Lacinutrix mariniflava TaxID=342955 RepID=UPI0006E2A738|nr:carboxypeptidase-like regulatory domain-containing protein [Lacinutrix mariniflava]
MKTKKTTSKIILAVMVLFAALFNSCNPNEAIDEAFANNDTNAGTAESTLDQGSSIQRDFIGRIVDAASLPIDNANIIIGNKTAITDANGVFIISDATVKERQAFITAEKPGYLKGMRSVVPTTGTNAIRIMLINENLAGTVASGVASEVILSNGTKVSFDGAFKDENGNAYSGNVDVYMYHLETSNPSIDAIMPGSLQAQNTNGEERILETYGMLNVELKGDSGQKLNIADGHVAEIEISVDPLQTNNAPSSIPLWHFDEVAGHWIEDGEANLVGGKYIGEVSHFSWWNYDVPFPSVQFCLTVVDGSNIPLSNVKIELWSSVSVSGRIAYSNGNGEICGQIPSNETFTLNAFDQCGVQIYTTTVNTVTTDINYGNLVMPGVIAKVISGNLVDCSNVNVTSGYVSLNYGSQFSGLAINNGAFNMSVIQCASLNAFTLEGFNYNTFETTTVLPFNFSNSNVGNLIACSTISEYISIQKDNEPVEFYLVNLNANLNPGNGYIQISSQVNGGIVYIDGNSSALNTYTTSDFSIESSVLNMDHSAPDTLQYTLANFDSIGGYVDLTISGTYTDNDGVTRNATVTVHVIRDM